MTIQTLREDLDYNQETGVFTRRSGRAAGNRADRQTVSGNGYPYYRVKWKGKLHKAHVLAVAYVTGEWPDRIVDHKNGNSLDNRWENLRLATAHENQQNRKRRKDSKGVHKGVSPYRGRHRARVTIDGKRITLGEFATEDLAIAAYRQAVNTHHGEFACFR